MDHRVPKVRLMITIVCIALATLTFIGLNLAFEGPSVIRGIGGEGRVFTATFKDTEILQTKQPVLLRGLDVGKIKEVDYNPADATATVKFAVDEEYAVFADASVAIGERTILGDPYLRLDPGTEAAGPLEDGSEVVAHGSVDYDEALDFLDEDGREHLHAILGELADAVKVSRGGERLNSAVGELARLTRELRRLVEGLSGEDEVLAELISDSGVVVGELGDREAAIRSIVGAGRETLDALAANAGALEDGLGEVPPLLAAVRRLLVDSRPLLARATPLLAELTDVAPELAPVLEDLPSIAADSVEVTAGLAAIPTFRKLLELIEVTGPAVPGMEAVARNLVPMLDYAADRRLGIAAFFANMVSVTASHDSDGHWARFAILFEEGELDDAPTPAICEPEDDLPVNAGFCHNPYPGPTDALDNEPYVSGTYPQLEPFDPPPPPDG
jgi:phospholipid/cholesterol/gamma-HCH transport system substrate-binding protein